MVNNNLFYYLTVEIPICVHIYQTKLRVTFASLNLHVAVWVLSMTQPVFLWKESIFHPSPFRSSIYVHPLVCYTLLCYIPHVLQHFTALAFTYFACLELVMVTTFGKGML